MTQTTELAETLEARDDVVRAVDTWTTCDVAVLVEDGTDLGPIRGDMRVAEVTDCSAAPFVILELDAVDGGAA